MSERLAMFVGGSADGQYRRVPEGIPTWEVIAHEPISLADSLAGPVTAEMVEIKREVSNLPALERRAHAELAKSVLAGSKDGQALLQRLRLTARPMQTVEVEAAVA